MQNRKRPPNFIAMLSLALLGAVLFATWIWATRIHTEPRSWYAERHQLSAAIRQGPPPYCKSLYRYVCGESPQEKSDPTGSMSTEEKAQQELFALRDRLKKRHPRWNRDQIDGAVAAEAFSPERRKRIQDAFVETGNALIRILEKQSRRVLSQKNLEDLLARLHRVQLIMPPPVSLFADDPEMLYRADAVYERMPDGQLRIRMGGAYLLSAKSWFNQIFTLAHELAHAIDPCEMKEAALLPRAYPAIQNCLLRNGQVARYPGRKQCEIGDQLSEAFADWIATQVVGESLSRFATEFSGTPLIHAVMNSVQDLCEGDSGDENGENHSPTTHHPSPRIRIDRIFGRHAPIRQILGCPASPLYQPECTWSDSP